MCCCPLQGAAITAIQIDGVLHEFSRFRRARDVTDLVLNVKEVAIKMGDEGPKRLTLNKQGPGAVTGDIRTTGDIEILILNSHLSPDDGAEVKSSSP